jgi:hypothetical protein
MPNTVGSIPLGAAPKGVIDPNLALQQAQLQRRMALAQLLQQNAQEAGNSYSSLNGMKVVPRMGIAPGIAQIANTLLGGYEQKKAYGDQASLAQQQAALQAQQASDAYGGGASGSNPIMGLTPTAFAAFMRQDPAAAYKFAAEHQALTDTNRQYVQQGRDLHDVGVLGRAHDVVQGTQTFQPGTTNIVPGSSAPFVAADFVKGMTGGYDAQGNPVVAPIQGAQSTLANLAGAQQAATSANTILPSVPLSNGATVPMWAGQAAGGQAPQGFNAQMQAESGGNQGAVSSAGARGVAQLMPGTARQYEKQMGFAPGSSDTDPQINAKIGQQYMTDLTNKYMKVSGGDQAAATALARMAYNAGPGKIDSWMQSGMNPSALPQETQDYNGRVNAAAGGQAPAGGLPAPVPKAGGPVGIGQSTMDKALSEKRAGNIADLEQDISDKASSAQAKLANNAKIQALVPQITTGPCAGNMTKAKSVLNSLGWTGADPTNNQEFEKYAMQAALESAKQVYGNRITNADLMSLPHWNPSDSMTTNALNAIIDSDNIKQGRLLQRQNVYNEYRNQGGDLNQFSSYYNKNYPEQGVAATESLAPGAAPVVTKPAATKVFKYNPTTGKLEAQ